jgi:hypothetical protein
MIILIENLVPYHYEVIESVIVKHGEICKLTEEQQKEEKQFILNIIYDTSFVHYITKKYPGTVVLTNTIKDNIPFDYYINCTYMSNYPQLVTPNKRCFYINHADLSTVNKKNFYALTPLAGKGKYINCDVLPFMNEEKVKTRVPIYIIQGNINTMRRNYELLRILLETDFGYDFKIKIVGRGEKLFGNNYLDKLIYKLNLPFFEYHREFLDAYCLLPLITKQTNPQYYTHKLTSSINYINAYKLKTVIDKNLYGIHPVENAYIYKDLNGYLESFKKSLEDFYGALPIEESTGDNDKKVSFELQEEKQEQLVIPAQVPRKRVALVKYSEKFPNLGDCLMTLSLKEFLEKNDIIVDRYYDRKSMVDGMIVSGFQCRMEEPLPKWAMYIGMFSEARNMLRINRGQLIGCRCVYTLDQLRRIPGTRGIITCCSTNTLDLYEGERSGELRLYHADLHTKYMNYTWDQQIKATYELLENLKKAAFVHTDRLHVALPCIALGTPVVLEKRAFKQERYSIFNIFNEFPGYGKVITKESGLREAMKKVFVDSFEVIRKEYNV